MISLIRELFFVLTPSQKKRLYRLQFLILLAATFETITLISVVPFMGMLSDNSLIDSSYALSAAFEFFGFADHVGFIYSYGLAVLVLLFLGTFISAKVVWRVSVFSQTIGAELSAHLFKYYMSCPWLFHAKYSSSTLTNLVLIEVNRLTGAVIGPFMHLLSKVTISSFILLTLFLYDPKVVALGVLLFGGGYVLLFRVIRAKLVRNGKIVSVSSEERLKALNNGFKGVKDLLLTSRSEKFEQAYEAASQVFAENQGTNLALSQVPRYFMEMLAFGSLIIVSLVLIQVNEMSAGAVLSSLALYGVAGLKLLPSFQQIYAYSAQIKGNIPAFYSVRDDLLRAKEQFVSPTGEIARQEGCSTRVGFKDSLSFEDVSFSYPGEEAKAVDNVSMTITPNSVVGVVGFSGAGKSTLIDLLLGLVRPSTGSIELDGKRLEDIDHADWGRLIGFVPQNIFLSDDTLKNNIALGVFEDEVDMRRMHAAVEGAHLNDLIGTLPDGLETMLGEDGVRLSGGQKQRVGIARALYNSSSILVFDEATSALDVITEKTIMDAVDSLSGTRTIVMIAHRLSTVRNCDIIYFMESGKIVDSGTYDDLFRRNRVFKEMTGER